MDRYCSGLGSSNHLETEALSNHAGVRMAIVYGATQRSSLLPDVPTMSESGLAGYERAKNEARLKHITLRLD